ncbi:MAG: nuclear transport factor 2 family protein, partial [Hyphomicrobiaceae bacterium]
FGYEFKANLLKLAVIPSTPEDQGMTSKKDLIRKLLKGIETGDAKAAAAVDEEKYIQHNPHTQEGSEGLADLFKRLSKTSPRVNIVRLFEDGDFIFGHTEYDFSSLKIGFEVFRFENGIAVEHWDNIQPWQGPNPSGRSMVDGPTETTDLELTEINRETVQRFVDDILIERRFDRMDHYIENAHFIQHSPQIANGLDALRSALTTQSDTGATIRYDRNHRVLAEGNFVLAVSEGHLAGVHTSFYDLFRVAHGKIVEHWDTIEAIPPRSEWKNDNGKF